MSDCTPELAKEIRERCEKATPGPWEIGAMLTWMVYAIGKHYDTAIASTEVRNGSGNDEDALFIAHARTDLPAALDRLEAQDREIERLRTALAAYRSALRCGEPETDQLRATTGRAEE